MSEVLPYSPDVLDRSKDSALELFLTEVHCLAKAARDYSFGLHRMEGIPVGVAAVLQLLLLGGPQTVPRIGRARSTSRQNTQVLVNRMLEEGWVVLVQNPAHKRSALVQLTESGIQLARAATNREEELRRSVSPQVDIEELEQASGVIERVRRLLGSSSTEMDTPASNLKLNSVTSPVEAESERPREPDASRAEPENILENELPVNLL